MTAAAALLVTACGGFSASQDTKSVPATTTTTAKKPKPTATPKPLSDTEQLNRMLTARAAALRESDAAAFLATSSGSQAKKDKRAIAAAKALPISDVRMTADAVDLDGDRGTLRVYMSYRFEDIDTFYGKTSSMRVRKSDDGWRITRDKPSYGTVTPWEHTRYKARTSKHFLALAPASLKVGALMSDLEKGRSRMRAKLKGVTLPKKVLVIVNRNSNDTRTLTKDYRALSGVVAIAEAQYTFDGTQAKQVSDLAGQRVFVLWRSYGNRGGQERRSVIAHELAHVALAKRTGGRVPIWLSEGIAMYVAGETSRVGDAGALLSGGQLRDASKQAAAQRTLSLTRLAKPSAMNRMSSVSLAFAYSYSAAAAFAIADKYGGSKALLRLHTAFNSSKYKGRPGRLLTNKVFEKVLGTSLTDVEADVEAYARARSSL